METCSGDLSMGDLSMVMAMASLPTSLHCMRLAQSEPKASASALANGTVDLVKSLPSHFEEASGSPAVALVVGFCNTVTLRLRGLVLFQRGRELRARGRQERGETAIVQYVSVVGEVACPTLAKLESRVGW